MKLKVIHQGLSRFGELSIHLTLVVHQLTMSANALLISPVSVLFGPRTQTSQLTALLWIWGVSYSASWWFVEVTVRAVHL